MADRPIEINGQRSLGRKLAQAERCRARAVGRILGLGLGCGLGAGEDDTHDRCGPISLVGPDEQLLMF